MTARSEIHGHPIEYTDDAWRWKETGKPITKECPCCTRVAELEAAIARLDTDLNGVGVGDIGRIEARVQGTLSSAGLGDEDADEWARVITTTFRHAFRRALTETTGGE